MPTLLTSVAAPIISQQTVGCGDIRYLTGVTAGKVNSIKPWEGSGYAMLLSSAGNVVSYPDKSQTSKAGRATHIISAVRSPNSMTLFWARMLVARRPVVIGNSDQKWYLGVVAPVSKVMEAAHRQLINAVILMVISIPVVCALLGLVFSRKVLKPIGGEPLTAATIALAVADGKLDNAIPLKARQQQSVLRLAHHAKPAARNCRQIQDASASVRRRG